MGPCLWKCQPREVYQPKIPHVAFDAWNWFLQKSSKRTNLTGNKYWCYRTKPNIYWYLTMQCLKSNTKFGYVTLSRKTLLGSARVETLVAWLFVAFIPSVHLVGKLFATANSIFPTFLLSNIESYSLCYMVWAWSLNTLSKPLTQLLEATTSTRVPKNAPCLMVWTWMRHVLEEGLNLLHRKCWKGAWQVAADNLYCFVLLSHCQCLSCSVFCNYCERCWWILRGGGIQFVAFVILVRIGVSSIV